ncbi:MAG: hypothetical protein IPK13_04265 [Deltaproteobacteria bacterium]|nr:hypothetical protein [Deltaproteobacteria bacterium]
MKSYVAGPGVPSGIYLSALPADLAIVHEDGRLVGPEGARYRRIPLILAVAMGPVIGGMYAVAFPLLILWAVACAARQSMACTRTYMAGQAAPWGLYVGLNRLSVRYISASGEALVGPAKARYLKIPTWISVLASPLIGGLYVVFFPLILAAALFVVLGELLYAVVTRTWADHAHLANARFSPSAAYLNAPEAEDRSNGQGASVANSDEQGDLDALEAEARTRQARERKDRPQS